MNININTFNNWAIKNKDVDMQNGHINAVNAMFDLIKNKTQICDKSFKFLDIGCGNGWVVRKALELENCILAEGIDGAPAMIKKAKIQDKKGTYYTKDIESWTPNKKYDIIFSMEAFYYFKDPGKIIKNLNYHLETNGILIIGIDHYMENTPSLNWEEEYNISTNTFKIEEWKDFFINANLDDVVVSQYGQEEEWQGTLILLGNKKT